VIAIPSKDYRICSDSIRERGTHRVSAQHNKMVIAGKILQNLSIDIEDTSHILQVTGIVIVRIGTPMTLKSRSASERGAEATIA
jgi:hypothetical protein